VFKWIFKQVIDVEEPQAGLYFLHFVHKSGHTMIKKMDKNLALKTRQLHFMI